MRTALSIGFVGFLAACAGAAPRPQSEERLQGRRQEFVLRNGVREAVSIEPREASIEDSTTWTPYLFGP